MKNKEKIIKKAEKLLVKIARRSAEIEANTTCSLFSHQEREPNAVKKLRKF